MRRFSRWLVGQLMTGLGSVGRFWLCFTDPAEAHPDWLSPPDHGGPPAGHPERMCRGVPLSRAERLLRAEIDGIGDSRM